MSTSGIGSLSASYLQQALASALQSAGNTSNAGTSGITSPTSSTQSDSTRLSPFAQLASTLQPDLKRRCPEFNFLSPFAQLASTLQQLQQSNPAQYASVTKQIATNLQSAASAAQSQGNTTAATQLNQLATDFTTASQTGQLPNLQDLSQALTSEGGSTHHHHHHGGGTSGSTATSTSSSTSGTTGNASSQALNPSAIILQTLANGGIDTSNN